MLLFYYYLFIRNEISLVICGHGVKHVDMEHMLNICGNGLKIMMNVLFQIVNVNVPVYNYEKENVIFIEK